MFAQHERTLTGESPQTAQIVGRLQPKTRVSAVRRNLKEVGGKRLADVQELGIRLKGRGNAAQEAKAR